MATIDIRTIKVLLDTNIPGKEIVPLTKSILYQPKMDTGKWNDMPFFTMDAEYPETYLSSFTYEEQMEFFFVKRKMIEILRTKSHIIQKLNNIQIKTQSQTNNENNVLDKINKNEINETTIIQNSIHNIECRTIERMEKFPMNTITYKNDQFYKGSNMLNIEGKNIKDFKEYKDIKKKRGGLWKSAINDFLIKKQEMFELSDKGKWLKDNNGDPACKVLVDNDTEMRVFKYIPNPDDTDKTKDPFWLPQKNNLIRIIQEIKNDSDLNNIIPKDLEKKIQDINFIVEWEYVTPENYFPIQKIMCKLQDEIDTIIPELNKLKDALNTSEFFIKELVEKEKMLEEIKKKYKKEKESIGVVENTGSLNYEISRNIIGEKNIMIMIRLMFPTKYPLVGNIFSSFHSVVTGKNEFNLKWTDFLPNFLKKQVFEGLKDYSYLKLDGTIYTVTQAIWLNDIYNHKEYKKLIDNFEELQRWKDKEIIKNNNELNKRYKLFQQTYRTGTYELKDDDINLIKKTLNVKINEKETGRSSLIADRLDRYKAVVERLVISITKLIKYIKEVDINKHEMLDNATQFVDLMKGLRDNQDYRGWFVLEQQDKFDRISRKMREDIDIIKTEKDILDMYLKRPGINMDYEKDTKHKALLEQKYSTYVRFVDNIRKFRAPILESSNFALQNTIEDFLNNTEKVKNVFIFLMNPINVKKNPFSELVGKTTGQEADDLREEAMNYQERLNTGITIRPSAQEGQPYYEVYLQVNVIGGEVNDDNKSAVDCMYQGESLGDKLARLLNEALYLPWTMNNSRIFFDITKGEAKTQLDKQEKDKKGIENSQKEETKEAISSEKSSEKKMGGKTRNFREYLMKTQRRYPVVS